MKQHSVYLLYHYFHPDDVISARLFSDLAVGLTEDGYSVVAVPSIRSCHDARAAYPKSETWAGGRIHRVWRPGWSQQSNRGRMANMMVVLAQWSLFAIFGSRSKRQTVIIGTDPMFAVLTAFWWRLFRPSVQIIHWCHDVYPDAAVADGLVKGKSPVVRLINFLLRHAYRRCDVVADLGNCMRKLLQGTIGESSEKEEAVQPRASSQPYDVAELEKNGCRVYVTMPPWSLVEPTSVPDRENSQRKELFGDARLGLLYSGNLGRAHLFEPFISLAEELGREFAFCFAGRGAQFPKLQEAMDQSEANVSIGGFAPEEILNDRLAAADIQLVSLSTAWTGSVVPSKFFGALAIGRPVLFAGSEQCCIAKWIGQFQNGWVLNERTQSEVAEAIRDYADNADARLSMNVRCQETYYQHFARAVQLARWRSLIAGEEATQS